MTNLQKNEIIQLIEIEKQKLGSYAAVATKCSVSKSTISNILTLKHDNIKSEMWLSIGYTLGYNSTEWQSAETFDFKKIHSLCNDVKNEHLFRILSAKAGMGKSTALEYYADVKNENRNKTQEENNIFYIRCREWSGRKFLTELCISLGIDPENSKTDELGEKVSKFFQNRTAYNPILIVDEADKLKDSAIRWFIHFENENKNITGCLLAGTEYLEKRIRDGVRLKKQGYDEIESRFRRTYVKLIGSREADVKSICEANRVFDKVTQTKIFTECNPTPVIINNQSVKVVTDLRNIQGKIARELRIKNELKSA